MSLLIRVLKRTKVRFKKLNFGRQSGVTTKIRPGIEFESVVLIQHSATLLSHVSNDRFCEVLMSIKLKQTRQKQPKFVSSDEWTTKKIWDTHLQWNII